MKEKIEYCKEFDNTIIVIVTEWNQIKEMSLEIVKKLLKDNIIIDDRNFLDIKCIEFL